jgi:hypothetical protein
VGQTVKNLNEAVERNVKSGNIVVLEPLKRDCKGYPGFLVRDHIGRTVVLVQLNDSRDRVTGIWAESSPLASLEKDGTPILKNNTASNDAIVILSKAFDGEPVAPQWGRRRYKCGEDSLLECEFNPQVMSDFSLRLASTVDDKR